MQLTLLDRIVLSYILPKEGTFTDLILAKEIAEKTKITSEEVSLFGIKVNENGSPYWNEEGVKALFDYEFTAEETLLIKTTLEKLNTDKKGTVDMLNLYELFVK